MTVTGHIEEKVEVPKGVKVTMEGSKVDRQGTNGTLTRDFTHPKVKVEGRRDHIVVSCEMPQGEGEGRGRNLRIAHHAT